MSDFQAQIQNCKCVASAVDYAYFVTNCNVFILIYAVTICITPLFDICWLNLFFFASSFIVCGNNQWRKHIGVTAVQKVGGRSEARRAEARSPKG